jgi:hypothetical protein
MNKPKKSDPKKILVRNTERPIPKTRLIIEEKAENKEKKKSELESQQTKSHRFQSKFQSPELNSALRIAKKIDKVEKTKVGKVQKIPDVAFNEKVTRKINFPVDQLIYKDLIPLQVPSRPPPVLSSREPLPQKDKEPVLSSYAKVKKAKEFIYQPSIKSSDRPSATLQLNNLRLYKIIQMNQ